MGQAGPMTSIRKEIVIDANPDAVWDAVRDWGALHERLAPGFVVATELDGTDRIVTFFNGAVAREVLVDSDDETRRLAWSITGGPYAHHNGSSQVFADGPDSTRFVWIADFLPDELGPMTNEMMERGMDVMAATLGDAG
jgi:carbon monoxide dehydrogenase subunit G